MAIIRCIRSFTWLLFEAVVDADAEEEDGTYADLDLLVMPQVEERPFLLLLPPPPALVLAESSSSSGEIFVDLRSRMVSALHDTVFFMMAAMVYYFRHLSTAQCE